MLLYLFLSWLILALAAICSETDPDNPSKPTRYLIRKREITSITVTSTTTVTINTYVRFTSRVLVAVTERSLAGTFTVSSDRLYAGDAILGAYAPAVTGDADYPGLYAPQNNFQDAITQTWSVGSDGVLAYTESRLSNYARNGRVEFAVVDGDFISLRHTSRGNAASPAVQLTVVAASSV